MNQAILASLFNLTGKSALLDDIIILFGSYWEYAVVVSLILYLLYSRRRDPAKSSSDDRRASKTRAAKNVGWAIVAAMIARLGIVNIIRFFYVKDRPFVFEEFTPLLDHVANASFPSGHAAFFMAIAVYFLLVSTRIGGLAREKKFGWFLFASAVLISVARVTAGIHWPLDILAGWAIGFLVALCIWYLANKRKVVQSKNTS
jgi:undecaprenyl-diphosphatase